MVHSPNPKPPPPPRPSPGSPWANPPKKKNLGCRYIQVRIHTHSVLIQTINQSLKRWENATSGRKTEATNLQNTEFLCFEFLKLVELLIHTVYSVNLHHYLGIYAVLGKKPIYTFTHLRNLGAGARKACKPP